ncbi:UBN2 domain-containing protein [Cephalotus follicularis]|uniref:UBN2 domain-containing protein n=1 Tax=Cephalotus follicularis TaxID=3775 RepID=A0A1Q3BE05_CEPFO|nr:UBN2 domain-containing protein [Cephalotus follicularis]
MANLQAPPVFAGEDYGFWSSEMMTYLNAYDLWDTIEKGYTPPKWELPVDTPVNHIKKLKEEKTKNFKALTLLHSAVSNTLFPKIVSAKSAKEACDTLKEEFQGSKRTKAIRVLHLRRQFSNLEMKESEEVKDYISKLIEIVNQMKIFGGVFTDKEIIERLLICLPEKFDSKIAAIEESRDLATLTVTELIGSLQAHEQRLMKRI